MSEMGLQAPGLQEPQKRLKRVAVIGTGGTFAMHARHRFDWIEYGESGVVHQIGQVLEDLRDLGNVSEDVELVPVPFRAIGSTAICAGDWVALARLVRTTVNMHPALDGIVMTHGTATMEETAWYLSLTLDLDIPIVLTGAQRPANTAGSDAPANLRAALAVAKCPAARGLGVLVVMDGWVYGARDVTKASSFDLSAFEAPPFGPLGRVDANGAVHIARAPRQLRVLPVAERLTEEDLPRVDIVLSYAGADGALIRACVDVGCRGIVCAGLAPGRPAGGQASALAEAARKGVVVVQSTRAARPSVPEQAFLRADGILAGGDLAPQKLRIFLMLALTQTSSLETLRQWLREL